MPHLTDAWLLTPQVQVDTPGMANVFHRRLLEQNWAWGILLRAKRQVANQPFVLGSSSRDGHCRHDVGNLHCDHVVPASSRSCATGPLVLIFRRDLWAPPAPKKGSQNPLFRTYSNTVLSKDLSGGGTLDFPPKVCHSKLSVGVLSMIND